jgi:hypothetical protein
MKRKKLERLIRSTRINSGPNVLRAEYRGDVRYVFPGDTLVLALDNGETVKFKFDALGELWSDGTNRPNQVVR